MTKKLICKKSIEDLNHRMLLTHSKFPYTENQLKRPCLFLDRDGVIIEDCHHISNPDQVKLLIGAKELINFARSKGWLIVVVSNQSGIYRGFFTWDDYEAINKKMLTLLDNFYAFDAIYANGYGPNAPLKSWRKPSPAMLLTAKEELGIDLSKSILIGDRVTDLEAGNKAGLKFVMHVLSGHGKTERKKILAKIKKGSSEHKRYKEGSYYLNNDDLHSEVILLNSLKDIPLEIFKN